MSTVTEPGSLRLLEELTASADYAGQLVHVEQFPERPARYGRLDPPLSGEAQAMLAARSIRRLYTHQAQTIAAARRSENVVTVTGTASGKTLGFLLPVIELLERDPEATALLLYPTKALAQDQLQGVVRLLDEHKTLSGRVRAGVYDGDTSQSARKKIRDEANLILTNPDMLHRGILPYHAKWHRTFRNLGFVVIDEVHTYRGIFGSNVGNVLRRLRRVVSHYRFDRPAPVYLTSSATIRNPKELAERLTGEPFTEVNDDGSPRGPKTFCLWNPPFTDRAAMERKSGNVEAKNLLVFLVERGIQTITFTKARVVAELIYRYAREELTHRGGMNGAALAARLNPYRGGYLPSERREIERRLFSGELLGVISTNALELGIDIGSLDAAILVGFPGTVASVWQQAGRAGRSQDPALTVFVGYNDPIDQYLIHHPAYFFGQNPEAAVCDPDNPYVLASHLSCAAFELPLTSDDLRLFGDDSGPVLEILRDDGELLPLGEETHWSSTRFPAQGVSLRTMSDDTFTIVDADQDDRVIGMVDAISAPELVYPEAIYLHQGETFFVTELDLEKKVARVNRIQADYYTQPVIDASILVRGERDRSAWHGENYAHVDAQVTWATTMFKKLLFGSMDSIGYKNLDLPPQHLETVALAWGPSADAVRRLFRDGLKPIDGLHGVRNLAITMFPILAMCDRADMGGVVDSSNTGSPTLYLYDRFPGGLGFSERAFLEFDRLIEGCFDLLTRCPCHDGCPSCVGIPVLRPAIHQDPDAGHGFSIPNKTAARRLLESAMTGDG